MKQSKGIKKHNVSFLQMTVALPFRVTIDLRCILNDHDENQTQIGRPSDGRKKRGLDCSHPFLPSRDNKTKQKKQNKTKK